MEEEEEDYGTWKPNSGARGQSKAYLEKEYRGAFQPSPIYRKHHMLMRLCVYKRK